MRWATSSLDISRLNRATGPWWRAVWVAMSVASALLPVDVRPAMITRLPGRSPASILSRSVSPVGRPAAAVPVSSSSRCLRAGPSCAPTGSSPSLRRRSATARMFRSAVSMTALMGVAVAEACSVMSWAARIRPLLAACSVTVSA